MKALLLDLMKVQDHCSKMGWDGYRARPIEKKSWEKARRYAESMTAQIVPPNIGVDASTGLVSFNWGSVKGEYLSLTFDLVNDGMVQCLKRENGVFSLCRMSETRAKGVQVRGAFYES